MRKEELLKRIKAEKKERHEIVMQLSKTKKEVERLTKIQKQLEFKVRFEDEIIKKMKKDLDKEDD